jgi:hypothetical protein
LSRCSRSRTDGGADPRWGERRERGDEVKKREKERKRERKREKYLLEIKQESCKSHKTKQKKMCHSAGSERGKAGRASPYRAFFIF